jgi:ubiquinone biosynthesis protein
MLDPKLIPTPLLDPAEQPPIKIQHHPPQARFRIPYLFVNLLTLFVHALWLWALARLTEERLGEMLRSFCQRMGVLWIKLGQLISMRADLAPPGVRAELAKLLDRVEGFPGETAIRLIEDELDAPLDRCFEQFDPIPLAAASIGQVHKARLRDGTWVAVKVRRPDIQRVGASDMAFIRFIVRCLEWLRFKPEARWPDMMWELHEAMLEELDYRFEASNMRRMKKRLRRHGIYVPQVFGRYCTPAVLVMEYIRGVVMSDYLLMARLDPLRLAAWREENRVHPGRIARKLVHSLFRQTFEENLFHGDLHPGNIVLLRDSRLAFLDFGSLGSMERDLARNIDLYLQALDRRQYSKMVDIFFLFSPSLPPTNLAECKSEMIRRLQAWDLRCRVPELPYTEKSFNAIQDELVRFAASYRVSLVWTFFRMIRALTTMDASLRELIPRANFHSLVNSYYRQRIARTRDKLIAKVRAANRNLSDWFELQDRVIDDLRFRSGIVRRAAQVFERASSTISLFFARLFAQTALVLLLAATLLLAIFFLQHRRSWMASLLPDWAVAILDRVPPLDAQVWMLLFGILIYSCRKFLILSRRVREQDVGGDESEG